MAAFFEDTFTDTHGAIIGNRTPDTGTGWTHVAGSGWRIDNARAAPNGNFDHILADDLPTGADYDVQADYVHTGSVSTLRTGPGIVGRSTGNNVYIRVDSRDTGIGLVENNGGSFNTIGTYAHTWVADVAITVRLELRGTTAKVYVDDVERISGTVTITNQNQAGMRTENQPTYELDGIKLDNFSVSNPAAAPNDPTGVVASNPTTTTMDLDWTDTNSASAFPRMYRRITGTGPGNWTFVEQLASAAATSYTFTGLDPAVGYDFGVSYTTA